jgi:hypothetical protein
MGDRPGSLSECACVRTKMCRKDYGWSVGLVYDSKGLPGVTIVRLGVARVLQMILEPTLVVSRARTSQLRRIQQRTSQERGYVCIMHGSSGRDTVWYVCC